MAEFTQTSTGEVVPASQPSGAPSHGTTRFSAGMMAGSPAAHEMFKKAVERSGGVVVPEPEESQESSASATRTRSAASEPSNEPEVKLPLTPEPEGEKPNYDIDPALADPWDLPEDKRSTPEAEPQGFEKYRLYRGHDIKPSDAVLGNMRVEVDEIHAAAADVGIAARRDGISKEGAEAIFEMVGANYIPPKSTFDEAGQEIAGTFDSETCLQQLYGALGDKTQEVIADMQAWVGKRPAVAAYLEDGVMLGNHAPTLLVLSAIAQAAKGGLDITKPSDAKVYVERVLNDSASDYWTDGPLHKLTVQGVQFAMAVAESKK